MRTLSFFQRLSVVAATCFVATACSDTVDIIEGLKPVDPLFTSYVSLGNSITAGYQSGGINDSTQRESYAVMLAHQMNSRFAYPGLNDPGCPPPITNFQTQQRVGGGTSTTCNTRSSNSITDRLNNLAVPGATVFDPTSASTASSNALTTFILGGKTQVARARDANPTFVSAWIGNNDVLAAAVSGYLVPAAGVSPGITPVNTFQTNFTAMANGLSSISTVRGGVVIGVVNVTNAPILFPVARLLDNVIFKAQFDAAAGGVVTVLPNCVASPALVSMQIVPQMASGAHPRVISCQKNVPAAPVGDIFILDQTELATLTSTINAYNAHIQQTATEKGWAYWDPNPTLQQLRTSGCIATTPQLASATQTFGQCVSLDGVHPAKQAHVEITKGLIQVINTKYGTTIPAL